ncbi:MAG: phosphate acyltransferase PlsX [Elusimicrobia bacterium]|nr:phosphate acyltransferase PlsX [Elusimicrobiota bacterium]
MKIALDAAAGDFGPGPNIDGAVQAANAWGIEVVLVGPAEKIRHELAARSVAASDKRFEIVDAPEVIGKGEEPSIACRAKPGCSIMTACELAAKGSAAGVVSAGHSGATMVAALWHIKRIEGVLRPAIAAPIPTLNGTAVLLDAGANPDCKPWHLLQFAVMGSIYALHILKRDRQRVGILSIGQEDGRGNDLVKESIPLLKSSGLDFLGPVDGRDVPAGTIEVVVCDGFAGNVAVKVMEGTSQSIFQLLKAEVLAGWLAKTGGLLLRGAFGRLRRRMSYDEYGGAPLLGVEGSVVICHGKSNSKAIANALRVAKDLADSGINGRIRKSVDEIKQNLETSRVSI